MSRNNFNRSMVVDQAHLRASLEQNSPVAAGKSGPRMRNSEAYNLYRSHNHPIKRVALHKELANS